jgi:hypothetical protein
MPNTARKNAKPAGHLRWERGYRGHVYRDRKGRELGRVERVGQPVQLYSWSTAACRGSVPQLSLAKRLVEDAVRLGLRQGELFTEVLDAPLE